MAYVYEPMPDLSPADEVEYNELCRRAWEQVVVDGGDGGKGGDMLIDATSFYHERRQRGLGHTAMSDSLDQAA
jgi:hypothetical protein